MPLAIRCPECRKPLGIPDAALDKTIRCPLCQALFDGRDDRIQHAPLQELPVQERAAPAEELPEPVVIEAVEEVEKPLAEIPVLTLAEPERAPTRPPRTRARAARPRRPRTPRYLILFAFLPLGMVLVNLGGAWGAGQGYETALGLGLGVGIALTSLGLFFALVGLPVVLRVLATLGLNGAAYLTAAIFVVVNFLQAPAGPIAASEWKDFTHAGGRFRVAMPGSPRHQVQNLWVPPANNTTVYRFLVERRSSSTTFTAGYADFPWLAERNDARQLLTRVRDGAIGEARGRIVQEKAIWLDDHPGLEIEMRLPQGVTISRYYLVQSRLYQLTVTSTKGRPNDTDVRRFFDSFQLTAPQPVAVVKPAPPPVPRPPPEPMPPAVEPLPIAPRLVLRPAPPQSMKTAHDDLTLAARIEPFLAFTADPQAGVAFAASRDGILREYAYPDFVLRSRYRIDGQAYQAAYDGKRGLLYLAVCPAGALPADPHEVRPRAAGELRVYDMNRVPEGSLSTPLALKPAAVHERNVTIADLLLSADGDRLYYLDIREPLRPRAVRFDADRRTRDSLTLRPYVHLLRLAPDGKTLYAAGSKEGQQPRVSGGPKPPPAVIQTIDSAIFRVRRSINVDAAPFDLAVGSDGLLYLSQGNNHFPEAVIVDLDRNGAIVGRLARITIGSFLRLAAGDGRLYFSRHPGSQNHVESLALDADPGKESKTIAQYEPTSGGAPIAGSMFLTPDGRYLLFGSGAILALAGIELPFVHSTLGWSDAGPTRPHGESAVFDDKFHRLAFHPDGEKLALAGEGNVVCYLDVTGLPRVRTTLPPHTGAITALAVSSDGNWLAYASAGEIALWDGLARVRRAAIKGSPARPIRTLGFSADGRTLAVAIASEMKFLDVPTLQERLSPANVAAPVTAFAFSSDDRLLATFDAKNGVRLWDAAGGGPRLALPDSAATVLALAFRPDGKQLATAESSGRVRLWDSASGQLLAVLEGHAGPVRAVRYSPDGKQLLSCSNDGSARLWDVDRKRTVALLRAHATAGVFPAADSRSSSRRDGSMDWLLNDSGQTRRCSARSTARRHGPGQHRSAGPGTRSKARPPPPSAGATGRPGRAGR